MFQLSGFSGMPAWFAGSTPDLRFWVLWVSFGRDSPQGP